MEENISHEKYSVWKRIGIFIVDGLTSLALFLVLFFTVGTLAIKGISKDTINELNVHSETIYLRENLPYTQDKLYGLSKIDYDKFIDEKMLILNDVEKANEEYHKVNDEIDKELNKSSEYVALYKNFYGVYISTVLVAFSLSLIIFQLIIPLSNKKHQTLTMMMFKATLVDMKTNIVVSNYKILGRFFFLLICEFISVYVLINWIGIIFVGLVSLCVISLTSNRSTLHDLVLRAKIVENENSFLE